MRPDRRDWSGWVPHFAGATRPDARDVSVWRRVVHRGLHVELDRRELLGRHAVLAQERQPARVRMEILSTLGRRLSAESGIMVLDRLVQPFESVVGLASVGRH